MELAKICAHQYSAVQHMVKQGMEGKAWNQTRPMIYIYTYCSLKLCKFYNPYVHL